MTHIVVNIGCIECGVPSNLVGVFEDEEKANEFAKILDEKGNWRKGGENHYIVFSLKEGSWIDQEYLDIAQKG